MVPLKPVPCDNSLGCVVLVDIFMINMLFTFPFRNVHFFNANIDFFLILNPMLFMSFKLVNSLEPC